MAIGYGVECQKPEVRVVDRAAERRERERKAQEFRNAVWRRDKYQCRRCGRPVKRTLELVPNQGHVHHLRGRNVAPEDKFNPAKAQLWCASCHFARHGQKL